MSFFLQNKTSTVIITVLIVLNLLSIYFFVVHKRISHRGSFPRERAMRQEKDKNKPTGQAHFMERELGLDQTQKEIFQKLRKKHFRKSGDIRKQMGALREQMFDNLGNSQFNKDSLVRELSKAQYQMENDMFEHFQAVRNICSDEQKIKFDKMIKRITKKMSQHEPRSGKGKSE